MSKVLRQELEAKLASLKGPEWDSASESEEEEATIPAVDLSNQPKQKKNKQRGKDNKISLKNSSVIYLGHIPHGFYEKEMSSFFSQFGNVQDLRLSRSRRGGKSRGYAFIQFSSEEIAKIVAETMNGYLLEGKKLVCNIVEKEKVHPRLFRASRRIIKVEDWQKFERQRHNQPKTQKQINSIATRLLKNEDLKRKKLEALGIDYEFSGYKNAIVPPSKHTKF